MFFSTLGWLGEKLKILSSIWDAYHCILILLLFRGSEMGFHFLLLVLARSCEINNLPQCGRDNLSNTESWDEVALDQHMLAYMRNPGLRFFKISFHSYSSHITSQNLLRPLPSDTPTKTAWGHIVFGLSSWVLDSASLRFDDCRHPLWLSQRILWASVSSFVKWHGAVAKMT